MLYCFDFNALTTLTLASLTAIFPLAHLVFRDNPIESNFNFGTNFWTDGLALFIGLKKEKGDSLNLKPSSIYYFAGRFWALAASKVRVE